jgi:hypothetical protein
MDETNANAAFEAFLLRKEKETGEPLSRVPMPPQRLSAGWAFYYQSRAYLETKDFRAMLVGQGPVVIRDDGRIIEGGSLDRHPESLLTR